ncbi:AraC family transcriptional regulator [Paracoccus caeni]|uniref:AraC family transcriptional regulator n=2 Tax=Paracoccus caeni TaxID=657651 RepID=A0A934VY88_9RHOB|nr:AraC family transcriptional regulator [Paracoccus caeni]
MTVTRENIAQTPDLPDALSDVLTSIRFIGGNMEAYSSDLSAMTVFDSAERSLLIVRSGSVLLHCDAFGQQPAKLERGDVALLASGSAFAVSYPPLSPEAGTSKAKPAFGDCVWLRGTFHIDERLSYRLLACLPKVIILRQITDGAMDWLETASRFALQEIETREPGGAIMISRIVELLLIRVLRLWAQEPDARASWLSGASDPAISRALSAMHAQPARAWTVSELARAAGMSRSVFAGRFATLVGEPPLRYLIGLRLDKAAEMLQRTTRRISEVAEAAGYNSEAAFSRAFKLRYGTSPSQWRRQ